jgi:hypothetical protein
MLSRSDFNALKDTVEVVEMEFLARAEKEL